MRLNFSFYQAGFLFALLFITACTLSASAGDTIECYGMGTIDFEMYFTFDGANRTPSNQILGSQFMLGYGLTNRLSGYLGTTFSVNGNLVDSATENSVGLFTTPLDTDHLDLDILLDFSAHGNNQFTIGPGLELNWDAASELDSWGLYVRSGLAISGQGTAKGSVQTADIILVLGCYGTLGQGHQLLLEFDGALEEQSSHLHTVEKEWSTGGWALGYNTTLSQTLELISQAYLEIPAGNDAYSFGLMIGFIATIPTT